MGTVIRAEISANNRYWVEKHRYYELKARFEARAGDSYISGHWRRRDRRRHGVQGHAETG